MSNLLIRGGTVVDGTGAPSYKADVRVRDGVIAEIGNDLQSSAGERVVDAKGCYVTPGFIESHTHIDGLMWWQSDMDPLPGNGITTAIMGNCGFSVAPVSSDAQVRLEMVKIFSFFEDIPMSPFINSVAWDWRTWSEYKKSVTSKVKLPINYAAFVGHIAIRLEVMGMEAWDRAATPEEIGRMAAHLEDALSAGALGLSSNLLDHDGSDRPIPTLHADDAEFSALIDVLDRHPGSSMEVVLDTFMRMTGPASLERIARLCEGKKVRVQWGGLPTLDFQRDIGIQKPMQALHEKFAAEGRDFWTAFAHVSPTNTASVQLSLLWAQSNSYAWHEVVLAKTDAEKRAILADPEWRARARISLSEEVYKHSQLSDPEKLILLNSENGVGPIKITVAEYAKQTGLHFSDAIADWLLKNGLQSTIHTAAFPEDEAMVLRLLKDPYSVGNINDTGAHGQMFCGGGQNIMILTDYVREKKLLTIEEGVHVLTGKLANHFNLNDRGVLKVGKRADVVVFNMEELDVGDWEKVYDVPDDKVGKTWRWSRKAAPTRLTLVNGVPTFDAGVYTGATPGEMLSPSLA